MIIEKYLSKEIARSFFAVLCVLTVIYVANRFGRYLGQASVGTVPPEILVELTALKLVENLPLLLPLGLYLAVMLALGRLHRDSEMVAMFAGGVAYGRLLRCVLLFGAVFALTVAAVTFYFAPLVVNLQEDVVRRAYEETPISGLQPGQFREMPQGNGSSAVVYFEDYSDDGRAFLNAFGQRAGSSSAQRTETFVAERAYQTLDARTNMPFLMLEKGSQYTGAPGEKNFSITSFDNYARRLPRLETADVYRKRRAVPTQDLLQSDRQDYAAELQWRIAMPISVLVLVMIAVPLAHSRPREGRYARLFTAVLVFFIYQNAIGVVLNMIERGHWPPALGATPVHAIAVAVAGCSLWALIRGGRPLRELMSKYLPTVGLGRPFRLSRSRR